MAGMTRDGDVQAARADAMNRARVQNQHHVARRSRGRGGFAHDTEHDAVRVEEGGRLAEQRTILADLCRHRAVVSHGRPGARFATACG